MELTNILGTLISSDSVKEICKSAKADPSQVQNVLSMALPHLMGGIGAQAEDASTSNALTKALSEHGKKDTSNIGAFLSKVDIADGTKIIGHLLGSNKDSIISDISKKSGVGAGQVTQILSSAGPLIMSLVGKQAGQSNDASSVASKISSALSSATGNNNLLGQVVGGLFKGGK